MLLPARTAVALNPSLDVSQYAHTAWSLRSGELNGHPTSLAQTTDGYVWLGTEFGVLRFDGARFVPWRPPADAPMSDTFVVKLLAAP
jgi:ligand-binding sensor domain-containing protein